ncbi:MAG: cupin domain-containing protein [Actinomycetota bacterium]|nr:cupin domain-containing protein [Actinomycetota bacterium]
MTGAPDLVVRDSGVGEAIRWRAEMLVKVAAEETGGAFSLLETVTAPGGGPPLHLHDGVDEAFYVLHGTYEFVCGDTSIGAAPGAFVLLPRGVPHRYRSGPGGGRMLMLFSPGGTERYFRALAVASSEGEPPADEVARLAEHHGIQLLGSY